jgi:hypothetical protein
MSRRGWFLPETPDIMGLLRSDVAVTLEGLDQFVACCVPARCAPREDPAARLEDRAARLLVGGERPVSQPLLFQ